MNKHIMPGKRTIKTALSVLICYISISIFNNIFGTNLESFYAGLTAVFVLLPGVSQTKKRGYQRILGTIIGSVYALFAAFTLDMSSVDNILMPLIIFLGVILCIHTCYLFESPDGVLVSCIVLLACISVQQEHYVLYIIMRMFATIYAVFVTYMVNKYIYPYQA